MGSVWQAVALVRKSVLSPSCIRAGQKLKRIIKFTTSLEIHDYIPLRGRAICCSCWECCQQPPALIFIRVSINAKACSSHQSTSNYWLQKCTKARHFRPPWNNSEGTYTCQCPCGPNTRKDPNTEPQVERVELPDKNIPTSGALRGILKLCVSMSSVRLEKCRCSSRCVWSTWDQGDDQGRELGCTPTPTPSCVTLRCLPVTSKCEFRL